MAGVSTLAREVLRRNPDFRPLKLVPRLPHRLRRHGVAQAGREAHRAQVRQVGRVRVGLYNAAAGFTPLIDIFTHASADMVDIHVQVLLEVLGSNQRYLRIQDDWLEGHASSVDVATRENMEALIGIGRDLLQKPVARVNIDTGVYEPVRPVACRVGDGQQA
ncbi:hypothetical protein BS78_05G209500 [Paspalum vaginatum]|nr:hypothetical protein BS78_05G209500 [Paspalum vaginatum]